MHLVESITILVPSVFTVTVTYGLMPVAPGWQRVVDVIFVRIHQGSRCNRRLDQRHDGFLLDVGQHTNHDVSTALYHAENGWFLFLQRAAPSGSFQAVPSAFTPFFLPLQGVPYARPPHRPHHTSPFKVAPGLGPRSSFQPVTDDTYANRARAVGCAVRTMSAPD